MNDRLVEIGTDLGICWRKITEIQDECMNLPRNGSLAEGQRRNRLKLDELCLAERTYALEAVTTQLRATSLGAAIVQIVMAHRYVREIMDCELDERERQATCRSVERLLYSIVDCLEAEAMEQREAVFGTAYMPRDQDPLRCVREAVRTPCGRPDSSGDCARKRPRTPQREADGCEEASL